MDHFFQGFGVNIKKTFELPPPRSQEEKLMKLFVFFLVGKMAQTPKSFPKMPRIFLPQKMGWRKKLFRCTIFLLHILSPRTVHFVSLLQFVHEPWANPHQLATKPPKSCKSARPSLLPHPKQNDGAVSAHVAWEQPGQANGKVRTLDCSSWFIRIFSRSILFINLWIRFHQISYNENMNPG